MNTVKKGVFLVRKGSYMAFNKARTFPPGQFPPGQFPRTIPLPTRTIPPIPLKTQLQNYIYIHTCIHSCIHIYIHAYIHRFMHTRIYAYNTYMHTYIHIHLYTVIHIHLYTVIYIDIFWHTYTYMYTYIHTCILAYIHTDEYVCMSVNVSMYIRVVHQTMVKIQIYQNWSPQGQICSTPPK